MSFQLLFTMMRARYRLIVFALAITVTTAVVITDLMPRQYVATTSLVLNASERSPFDSGMSSMKAQTTFMATQLDILQSRSVALKVVDDLGIPDNAALRLQYEESGGGEGSMREWAAERLAAGLTIEPSRDSRVVDVIYRSADPEMAARVANAFAHAYIATTLDLLTDPARRNAEWFDEQLKVLRERLVDSQSRLTLFQQEHGIISIDERLDTETNRLNELARTYVQVQAEAADVRSRQLGENHPEYRRALSREQAGARSLEQQKQRLLELKQLRDQLELLAREVESNQSVYDSTLQRFYQSSLESRFNQPNTSVLNPAVAPLDPSSPMVVFNMVAAVVLGLLLGIGAAVLAELIDRRVRTVEDINEVLRDRVLAVV